jgi:curli biogenesis system outer membrane secretion channel CsgG
MRKLSINYLLLEVLSVAIIFLLIGCAAIDQVIHPDDKPTPPTWPTYGQLLEENYKGPKARVVITKLIDKSTRGQENSQAGDGITEMLRQAMLATNRYIVQVQKPLYDVSRGQNIGDNGRIKKEDEIDLVVEGFVKEFKQGIAGAGEDGGGASYVTLMVTVTNPRTNQILSTEKVRGKAMDFGGTVGKGGVKLPEVFKEFSKTPMEKAIRIAIEDSTSFIVAKTPPESYRVLPIIPPKETPKPPPVKVQPEVTLPLPPPVVTPPPPLRVTRVEWANVNLREGPGTNYKVIRNVKKGTSLGILEAKGTWLRVRLEDGNEAWVNKLATSEGSPSSPSPSPPKPMPM